MELNRYNDILIENGIEWESESMKAADVSKLDVRTVMALLVGAFRAERFCEGALMDFFKSGAILRWQHRIFRCTQQLQEQNPDLLLR